MKKLEKSPSIIEFVAKDRVQPIIAAIQEEYMSNARLLSYFAQNNPSDPKEDTLAVLEAALLQRQDMLVAQIADTPARSLEDMRAKLEIWAEEIDQAPEFDARLRIVLSVLDGIKALSA